jgi:hypothetical protein
MAETLVEAAARKRQKEQLDHPAEDGRDPWAISGPERCACGAELGLGALGRKCNVCRRHPRRHKACGIEGCSRPARANGRCRRHLHGDDQWWGWPGKVGTKRRQP